MHVMCGMMNVYVETQGDWEFSLIILYLGLIEAGSVS